MKKITICFIDSLGLKYTGDTIYKRGLGGSESSVIYLCEELAKIGFDVTVYNHCEKEGVYKDVVYKDLTSIRDNDREYDILISSRSTIPLVDKDLGTEVWDILKIDIGIYENITPKAKFKAVWMHDAFLEGEQYLEKLLNRGSIQEVFTLSDWHSHYISQSDHWGTPKRDYAMLKRHIFQTRNGMRAHVTPISPIDKDPNLFVHNSSITKGLTTLIEDVWPKVKERIPEAKLTVIGGYYQGAGTNDTPDESELSFLKLKRDYGGKKDITFTGIITPEEVSKILSKSKFMIYPPESPETFGISTMEALYYNVVPITSRFGALEQTAVDDMSYLIDYPVEKYNVAQHDQFVQLVENAYSNNYLTQQKQNMGNAIREFVTWDTIALQWKAHFYKKFDIMLSRNEVEKVRAISSAINRLFKTRHINLEDQIEFFPLKEEQRIVIISPVWNAENYIGKCIESVGMQLYNNYIHYIIDDGSSDNTVSEAEKAIENLSDNIRDKFVIIRNDDNVGALSNQISKIHEFGQDGDIFALLDGDDWLYNDPDIFSYINTLYPKFDMTYGSCWSIVDQTPLIAQEYPEEVKQNKTFRQYKFNWGIPYTHLRTFSYELFTNIYSNLDILTDPSTNAPYREGGDGALLYALLEACDASKIGCIQRLLVNYNDGNPEEQTNNRDKIVHFPKASSNSDTKWILIGIPSAKYVEPKTFKSIFDLDVPEGYAVNLEFFHGYNIAHLRNEMANWTITHNYDYILWVDSDIVVPRDALVKLIAHNKDCVGGLYIRRNTVPKTPEVFVRNPNGACSTLSVYEAIKPQLLSVIAMGFGCTLTSTRILKVIGYPQFEYKHSLIWEENTSEDIDFCTKVRDKGYEVFVDTSIQCDHLGDHTYKI